MVIFLIYCLLFYLVVLSATRHTQKGHVHASVRPAEPAAQPDPPAAVSSQAVSDFET